MMTRPPFRAGACWLAVALLAWAGAPGAARAQADLHADEEAALRAAVAKVGESVVRIETIGGLERAGEVLLGTGPTTGLIVSPDGYIISSAFNFAQKPASILVGLPDGTRAPARLVATDHSRMVVLLKVQVEEKLTPAQAVPESQMRVGQWAVAVGRTFESSEPNMSVGIISALARIWGRAIQTDAKISPVNYGGPLVDIHGQVLGVLVPLSPDANDTVAGYQWYDSGIGFAIPLEHILHTLPRLKEGKDLYPGIMGVSLRPGDQFADAAVIAAVRGNSPAYQAGMKAGDRIVELAGRKIVRQVQVKEALGPRYAGETIKVVVLRGDERIERDVELIAKLQPYDRPFLGVLPLRVARAKDAAAPAEPLGVAIRHVYSNSGADAAGLEPGDRIVSAGGKPTADRAALREVVAALEPGKKVPLQLVRGEQTLNLEIELGTLPEEIPGELPPAIPGRKPYVGQQPPVGLQPIKVAEFQNDCLSYVPESYDPAVPHGVVVWLHEPNGLKAPEDVEKLIGLWKPLCDEHDLILLAPRSQDPARWVPAKELAFLAKVLEQVRATYHVDDLRIAAAGFQAGGSMAFALAFNQRELIRAVAAVDAPLAGQVPDHEPVHPLAFMITTAKQGRVQPQQVEAAAKRLREMKYPVTLIDQGDKSRPLSAEELRNFVRWLDTLDRI